MTWVLSLFYITLDAGSVSQEVIRSVQSGHLWM